MGRPKPEGMFGDSRLKGDEFLFGVSKLGWRCDIWMNFPSYLQEYPQQQWSVVGNTKLSPTLGPTSVILF